jgi:tRNA threonylcarbamoyl adenosine modification protein YeaZ
VSVVLALDASLGVPSCAVWRGHTVGYAAGERSLVEDFATVIRTAVASSRLSLSEVDELAVCVGPGSYMGVRSAVTTANALGLALGKPISGVASVDAVAACAPASVMSFVVAVPAGRGRSFSARYARRDERVVRKSASPLSPVGEAPPEAIVAVAPGSRQAGDSLALELTAACVLTVVHKQRHLVIGAPGERAVPLLPKVTVGAPQ